MAKGEVTADEVKALVQEGHLDTIAVRRHLHANPELSFEEHGTARYVADALRAAGIAVRTGVAGTGVIGTVQGHAPGPVVCLRADMDALPVQEATGLPWSSRRAGVMHACGHDAHTAMVLGAGRILHRLRNRWNGTVLLLFQPGEEKVPGGASLVLGAGALRDPAPAVIIGQHVTPELELGKVGFCAGPFMASSDELYITVQGKGGHAARPETLVDPIVIAAKLLLQLKEEFEAWRQGRPLLLAFGRFMAEGATNVVPDEVEIAGTLRTFDEGLRGELHAWLPRRAKEICTGLGGDCRFDLRKGYPVLVNDGPLTDRLRKAASELLGEEQVVEMPQRMGSEDFAFYTQVMPGSFHRLGTGQPKKGPSPGLHNARFDLPEESLGIGVAMMVWAALRELRGPWAGR